MTMHFGWSTFALQTVNFAILVWLLHRFLYKPVLRLIDARRAEVDKQYADARAAEAQAEAHLAAVKAEREKIAGERAAVLKQAAAQAEEQSAARRAQAERDAAVLLTSGQKSLADERALAVAEVRRAALDLGADIAGRLLAQVPMKLRAEAWLDRIEHYIAALPKPDSKRWPARSSTASPSRSSPHRRCRLTLASCGDQGCVRYSVMTSPSIMASTQGSSLVRSCISQTRSCGFPGKRARRDARGDRGRWQRSLTSCRLGSAKAGNALPLPALEPRLEQVGRVTQVGDGVATVTGLPNTRLDELLVFEGGVRGLAVDLAEEAIGCVVLGSDPRIAAGSMVHGTGEVARVPVGAGLLGRVVDALGNPLDGGDAVAVEVFAPVEQPAPAIVDRALVTRPLATGLLVIDAMIPLGRGQRELIIGDRGTGKTAIAVDTIINQRSSDVICVYAAVGQKASSVAQVIEAVRRYGAPERCLFVIGEADAAPGLQWLTPYSACTMAEHFMAQGRDVLLVIDDLTKHAATYREISLLLRRPPGREAYPGDIFYIHSRLLERAAKLGPERGGGSLTALPIAETQAGNISAYIPTNLISITDGQIYLDPRLFYEDQKPAVDVGKSVSRVGGKTQAPVLRALSESLRLEYAQFLELEVFTRFGGSPSAGQRQNRARPAHPRRADAAAIRAVAARRRGRAGVWTAGRCFRPPAAEAFRPVARRTFARLDATAGALVGEIERGGSLDEAKRAELIATLAALVARLTPPPAAGG